jgi:hypothetical protein
LRRDAWRVYARFVRHKRGAHALRSPRSPALSLQRSAATSHLRAYSICVAARRKKSAAKSGSESGGISVKSGVSK